MFVWREVIHIRSLGGIRMMSLAGLILLAAGCSATYPYLPAGQRPAPGIAGESSAQAAAPAGQTPLPGPQYGAPPVEPQPDLAQKIQALDLRVQQLESRVAELEARKAPIPGVRKEAGRSPAPVAAAPKGYPSPGAVKAAPGVDQAFSEGMRLYQGKKYRDARSKFHQYLQGQPQGAKAPEARYHLADSFYQEGKYQEAAVEFNKLATQFPRSILAPAALLRQARAYKELQQTGNYRTTLKKLEKAYPQSPEAGEAKKWLKER